MAIKRIFLGHDCPVINSAVSFLFEQFGTHEKVDLQKVVVVVPGGRAGRRLLEVLVQQAEANGKLLIPPNVETVGRLPEKLYVPKLPFATDLTQQLVWAEVLKKTKSQDLLPIVPSPPALEDDERWLALADLLRRQHVELAGDNLSFADVVKIGSELDGFQEQPRWRAMQKLQEAYLRRLDELEQWDLQTARLEAVKRKETATDGHIILLGAVDLNVTQRKMLDQVASNVTALIFAPESWADRFDEHGCLIPDVWAATELPIVSEHVRVVDGPGDQATEVARCVASFDSRFSADDIVIGVPDEQLIPDIKRQLMQSGVVARWGPGDSYSATAPFRLLHAIAMFLDQRRFYDLAALVRHPDVDHFISQSLGERWLLTIDEFQNCHLPYRLDECVSEPSAERGFERVVGKVDSLLSELRGTRPLADWSAPLWRVLLEIYGEKPLDLNDPADAAIRAVCEGVKGTLQQFARIPRQVMPDVAASRAIRYLLQELSGQAVPAAAGDDAVEMLGWLELPLDDAPAAIVTSLNEGFVPESLNADLFLPNSLRQRLGLFDNARRYARDAYAVSVLSLTRESVHWIVGRRNHDGDPLVPSRLLFACSAETAAQRASQMFHRPAALRPLLKKTRRAEKLLAVPKPVPLAKPIDCLSVTAFRDYLACPYRFYLRHVLRLAPCMDDLDELDGRAFGNLAHDVLSRFGQCEIRDSVQPDEIREFLEHELDSSAARMFGKTSLPVVWVQVEQLRWRLQAFAQHQAAWCADGWQIEHVEKPGWDDEPAVIEVDGKPMKLKGRIDRIDVHRTTGERVILDYKTSDAGQPPAKTHRRSDQWIDLQLPLYRHIAAKLGIRAPVRLGYVLLPKDTKGTGFCIAEWGREELADADEVAFEVIRKVRREEFWPPADPAPDFSEDYSPICQDTVLQL